MMIDVITDMEIQAYIDNELPPEQQRQVLEILIRDPESRNLYKSLIRQKALLIASWREN